MTQNDPNRDQEAEEQVSPQAESVDAFKVMEDHRVPGLVRRACQTLRHVLGLVFGGLVAAQREIDAHPGARVPRLALKWTSHIARPFLDRDLVSQDFAVQLRRRLEILGPTYIKLGQILSLREDLLPRPITDELKKLLDHLPAIPFERFVAIVETELDRPVSQAFLEIDPTPTGSASIAQIHRAKTVRGDQVILKVVKPGVRPLLELDTRLLKWLGRILHLFLARFQPKRVIAEFCDYTLRELDLEREADNAETFAANFRDMPDIVFPGVHRQYSNRSVLCLDYLEGRKPDAAVAAALSDTDRDRLVDLGAAAIIRMIYQDGFFHADLHPANLLIMEDGLCAYIDLGMVGRFDDRLRRTMLSYFYCLVSGEAEHAATFLARVAEPGPGGDPPGFRQAVADLSQRWKRSANFKDFSLARLILESISLGGRYRMYFPVEMVLMVKALITFEGVGHILKPGLDVAELSKKHVNAVFWRQFHPKRLFQESLRHAPELLDALVKAPQLIGQAIHLLEEARDRPREEPFHGMRAPLLSGACLIAGAIVISAHGPWPLWTLLFALSAGLAFRGQS